MTQQQVSIETEVKVDYAYAGFWIRSAAALLDVIIMLPVVIITEYLNSKGKNIYFFSFIPYQIFDLWYLIYLPVKYGGTPGKLILGLKILTIKGKSIEFKQAVLRYSLAIILAVLTFSATSFALVNADSVLFSNTSFVEQTQYLITLAPNFFAINNWAYAIWAFSGIIVLLANQKKRTVHDFIAGTIVVKARH